MCFTWQVLRRLDNVDEKVIEFFAPAAKLVLERGDKHDAMCRALAALSGLIEVPKPRRWAALSVSMHHYAASLPLVVAGY